MELRGFGVGGYRSFREHQRIWPLSKINLFIGGNNSGKSNILRFVRDHLPSAIAAMKNGDMELDPGLDLSLGGDGIFSFSLALAPRDSSHIKDAQITRLGGNPRGALEQLLDQDALKHGTDDLWIDFTKPGQTRSSLDIDLPTSDLRPPLPWRDLSSVLTSHSSSDENNAAAVYNALIPPLELRRTYFVPAIREVQDGEPTPEDFSGAGLIDRLARLRDPKFGNEHDELRFEAVVTFMRDVLGSDEAELRIPFDREYLLVRMDRMTLPLESLGTGIHEVIILAVAATVLQDEIVCIEEPEIHLHPLLQRKLIRYLGEQTTNQYFIATHSAHLIDTPQASVFRVAKNGPSSSVRIAVRPQERFEICRDLGYRASDLLQTNAIIWVEGPTERIYLNHWLESTRPDLSEGIHYSVMWYGGRLLSNTTTSDEVDEFVSLRRLNRHTVVVMDSDRSRPRQRLNATKQRVRQEFESSGDGFAWVTMGREIENYVSRELMVAAVAAINPDYAELVGNGRFERMIPMPEDGYRFNKVRVAREVASRPADLGVLDLSAMIGNLIDFIDQANQEDPPTGQQA